MKKNNNSSVFFENLSLSNLLKLGLFQTIYAKSNPCTPSDSPRTPVPLETIETAPISDQCGPAEESPKISSPCSVPCPPQSDRCQGKGAGYRGKTGAGVSGSHVSGEDGEDNKDDLPSGALNPGLLRHIHNAARYRIPQCFEGACVSLKQNTDSNWVLGHSMSFSSVTPGGYKVMLSYNDKKKPTAMPYFIMEAAPGGQMSCEMRVGPTQGTRATVVTQISNAELHSFESIFDVYFKSFTTSVIAVNREFIAIHYLQALTDKLSLGAEIVARGHASELSSASGAARWANENHTISGTLGNRGLDLCYAKNVNSFLTVAAMLEVGFAIRRSVSTLAYEWRTDEWTVRGSADSDGLIGCTLQRALGGNRTNLTCAISALLNHPNDKFRLGFGITAAII